MTRRRNCLSRSRVLSHGVTATGSIARLQGKIGGGLQYRCHGVAMLEMSWAMIMVNLEQATACCHSHDRSSGTSVILSYQSGIDSFDLLFTRMNGKRTCVRWRKFEFPTEIEAANEEFLYYYSMNKYTKNVGGSVMPANTPVYSFNINARDNPRLPP